MLQRHHLLRACALLLAVAAAPALAQEPFLPGVYLGSQKLCDQAKSGSLQGVLDAGEYVLTAQGLKSAQEDCQFLRADKARGADAWLVATLCISEGSNYPDLYSVTKLPDGRVNVVSVYGGEDEDAADAADAGTPDEPAGNESVPQTAAPQPDAGGDAAAEADDNGVEPGFYVSCPGLAAP
jgi:hypothetical protein